MMRDLTRCMRLSDLELPADHGGMVSVNFSRQQQIEVSARNRLAIQQLHQQAYSLSNSSSTIKRRSGRMVKIDPTTRTSSASSDGGNVANTKEIDEQEEASLLDHIGERQAKDNSLAIIPRLSFHDVRNITSWTYARLILQNFGERYRIRMDLYIGGTIIMFVILAIVVFVRIYFTQNRIKGIVSAFILQVLLSITAISLLVLSILYTSALVNSEMEQHK